MASASFGRGPGFFFLVIFSNVLAILKIPHQQQLQNKTFITQNCCDGRQKPVINRNFICLNHLDSLGSPRTSSDISDLSQSTRKSVQANAWLQKGEGPAKGWLRLVVVHQKSFWGTKCDLIDCNVVYSCYILLEL